MGELPDKEEKSPLPLKKHCERGMESNFRYSRISVIVNSLCRLMVFR